MHFPFKDFLIESYKKKEKAFMTVIGTFLLNGVIVFMTR